MYICSIELSPWLGKTKARPRFRGLIFYMTMAEGKQATGNHLH